MQNPRNFALTTGGAVNSLAANFPTSPIPMGGSSLLVACVSVNGSTLITGITAPAGWTSVGAMISKNNTSQQVFTKSAASDTGTATFSWTGTTVHCEIHIVEIYSTQGAVPTLGTYATGTGTGVAATFPSPTLTQGSELLIGFLYLNANTNILYPGGPSFASGFGGGALTLYDNINTSTQSCVAFFGCPGTALPTTMPATSWAGSQDWVMTVIPLKEATAGDPVITGVGLIDNVAGASAPANSLTSPYIPATAQSGDFLVACVGQGKFGGTQATGQTITSYDPVVVGASALLNTVATANAVINKPTGVQSGDLLIASSIVGGGPVITPPAGWVSFGTNGAYSVFTKIAGASEPATYTFTWGTGNQINIFRITAVRSAGGGTLSIGGSFATTTAASGLTDPSVTPTGNALVIADFIEFDNGTPSVPSGMRSIAQSQGETSAYTYVPSGVASGTFASTGSFDTWGGATFYITSSINGWTRIRGDNEPNSTYSQDLYWRKYNGEPTTYPYGFTVPNAEQYLQGQIVSVGNVNTTTPIDDHQGASAVGQGAGWSAPPCIGVTSNTGLALWFWGLNQTFRDGSNRVAPNLIFSPAGVGNPSGAGPIAPVYDTYADGGSGSTPRRHFTIGYGSPELLDRPQVCVGTQSAKGWVGQSLALRAASVPVRTSNQLKVNLTSLVIMGSSLITSGGTRAQLGFLM